jgi:alkanesulfonate monooxygenase
MTTEPTSRPEVAWFSALYDDDYEYLGIADPELRSSWMHCRNIVTRAEANGFDNVLLPSGYGLGIDGVPFAGGIAAITERIKLLLAVRCGEMWPPQLARQLAGPDEMLDGRLTINIISPDLPGTQLASEPRYTRTLEVMTILRTLLAGESIDHHGEFYDLTLDAPRIAVDRATARQAASLPATPPFYFGGLSDPARDVAARAADVYLMWPDTMPEIAAIIADLRRRAERHGRSLRFGYRTHVVVRETEAEARAAATNCSRGSTLPRVRRSATARSTPHRLACHDRPNSATPPTTTATSRNTSGPGSPAPGPGVAPRSSAIPIRSSPNCAPT